MALGALKLEACKTFSTFFVISGPCDSCSIKIITHARTNRLSEASRIFLATKPFVKRRMHFSFRETN